MNLWLELEKLRLEVVSEEAEEEDSQEPRIRWGWRKPPGTYSQEQSLPGEGFLRTYLGKTAPENPLIPLNSLLPEDSTEDLAEELDEFFRFMIWNDWSGEEEEEKSSFIEDE